MDSRSAPYPLAVGAVALRDRRPDLEATRLAAGLRDLAGANDRKTANGAASH